jgi:hypothetical protein
MYWVGRGVVFTSLLVGCAASPLTPTGGGGSRAAGGSAGTMAGGRGVAGPGGAAGWAGARGGLGGLAGTQGGYAGSARAVAGASGTNGTGGSPVDASVPDPWSYGGRPVARVDVKWCPGNSYCAVCTLTLGGPADAAAPNSDYGLPSPICYQPPVDAGTDASSSLPVHWIAPIPCMVHVPDSGAYAMFTEVVLQPNSDAAAKLSGYSNAYCQFLPGPVSVSPLNGCQLTLSSSVCVSDCSLCP